MAVSKITHFWVFRFADGTYYRHDERGSWARSMNERTKKHIETSSVQKATRFSDIKKPTDGSPHWPVLHNACRNGSWLEFVEEINIYPANGGQSSL